ncbi:MAG: TIR domain-containing protein, partial [bacterium]
MPEYSVFLDFASVDRALALVFARRLAARGITVATSEGWITASRRDAETEDDPPTLLLLLTKAALATEWARLDSRSWGFRDPNDRRRNFVPVLAESCDLPESIRRFEILDWSDHGHAAVDGLQAFLRATAPPEAAIKQVSSWKPHRSNIWTIAVLDEDTVVTASSDGTVATTKLESGKIRAITPFPDIDL